MRVGLVLGAGGVMGGAWLTGGLEALARETGWDPGSADHIVGTSAGSMIGALCRRRRAAVVHGRPLGAARRSRASSTPTGRPAAEADRAAGATSACTRACRRSGPARWRLIATRLSRPHRHRPARAARRLAAARVRSRPSRSRTRSGAWCRPAGPTTRTSGSSPATTRPAAASPSAATTRPSRARRRRRGVLRDPGLLPPGRDRRPPLRRRRALLDLEPRPPRGPRRSTS